MTTPRYPHIRVRLTDTDGNAFGILGLVQRAMRAAGVPEAQRQEFFAEATSADYAHLLETVQRWVHVDGPCSSPNPTTCTYQGEEG
jgi:hypothetical protein